MEQQSQIFCGPCSSTLLESWQGWPHRNVIPRLPKQVDGVCEACGERSVALESSRITWLNHHGKYNTGLPDYWLLQAEGEESKWGLPYFAEAPCKKCGAVGPVSQMRHPNGTSELKINCAGCGIHGVR